MTLFTGNCGEYLIFSAGNSRELRELNSYEEMNRKKWIAGWNNN